MAAQAARHALLLAVLLLVAGSGLLAPCLARQLAQQQTLGPISNAASDANATQAAAARPASAGVAAPAVPSSQPGNDTSAQPAAGAGEAPWQQRRTLQLPPHVYLISFVMLLAIMAALLSCHCYRMCRIARRMRQAAELGVTVTSAGATLSKRTPQSVIESLPVSKYSRIHSQRSAKAAPGSASGAVPGSATSAVPAGEASGEAAPPRAAADDCSGAASGAPATARLDPFVAAAMQLREQFARQTGVASFSFGGSSTGAAAAGDAAAAAAAEPSPAGTSATRNSCSSDSGAHAAAGSAAAAPTTAAAALARLQSIGLSSSSSSGGGEPCAICFEEFSPEDLVKELPCRHFYHAACIDEWLVRDVTCPLCKAPVLDKELLEEQQRLAAALESSFGNVSLALRRQQALLSARRRQQQQAADGAAPSRQQLQGVPGSSPAAAPTAASAASAGAAEQQAAGDSSSSSAAGGAVARRRGQGTMLELLDLAAQVMLSFPGAPASRVNNNTTPRSHPLAAAAPQQQQQQQQSPASNGGIRAGAAGSGEPGAAAGSGDVEMGQRVVAR